MLIRTDKQTRRYGCKHTCKVKVKSTPDEQTKSTQERAARVRACNSVNLKPGEIIEPLLKIVIHMHSNAQILAVVAKHVLGVLFFSNISIILPGLWASIGVTRSYSSRPFLCALDKRYHLHCNVSLLVCVHVFEDTKNLIHTLHKKKVLSGSFYQCFG